MTGEPCPDTPCELCGDVTPGAALVEDPDRGWDALCPACWQLQQPPEPPLLWSRRTRSRPPWRPGLGRPRRGPGRPERDEEAW